MCHRIATQLSDDPDEPMPEFASADQHRLVSSLTQPTQAIEDFEPYPGLDGKAAALLYFLTKNHPFPNGNKRFATAAWLVVLALNGWWPLVTRRDLVNLVESVAASEAGDYRVEIERIAEFTRVHLIPYEEVPAAVEYLEAEAAREPDAEREDT